MEACQVVTQLLLLACSFSGDTARHPDSEGGGATSLCIGEVSKLAACAGSMALWRFARVWMRGWTMVVDILGLCRHFLRAFKSQDGNPK